MAISGESWERALLDELWQSGGERPADLRERLRARLGPEFDVRASDEEIGRAWWILVWLTEALAFGAPEVREPHSSLLLRVEKLIRDGGGVSAQRRAVVAHTESALRSWRGTVDELERLSIANRLRLNLTHIEGAFGVLDDAAVSRELGRSERREAALIAATLAVAVKAFKDEDVEKSTKTFRTAAGSAPG